MFFRIRSKVVFMTVAVLFFAIMASVLTSAIIFRKEYYNVLESKAVIVAEELRFSMLRILQFDMAIQDVMGFGEVCKGIAQRNNDIAFAMIADLDGRILFHNDSSRQGKILSESIREKLKIGDRMQTSRYIEEGEEYYAIILPIFDLRNKKIAAAIVSLPARIILQKTRDMVVYSIGVGMIFILVAAIILILVLSVWVTRPIGILVDKIKDFKNKQAELIDAVEIRSKDEVGELASAFNQLLDQIRDYGQKERNYTHELELRIEECKRAEEEARRARDELEVRVQKRTRELEQAQKELVGRALDAGRGQMAAVVLHNIGNALTPVKVQLENLENADIGEIGYFLRKCYLDLMEHASVLQDYVSDDHRGKEIFSYMGELIDSLEDYDRQRLSMIQKLNGAVSYIAEILNLQQAYAPSDQEIKEQVDLNALIQDALHIQMGTLEKRGIIVRRELDPNSPKLLIDKNKLMQVIVNLVKNSYEAIDALEDNTQEKVITLRSFMEDGQVVFEIKDTGVGIEQKGIIATAFEFGVSEKGSSGFGLYYCKVFIEANRGTIKISSPGKGKGATVRVSFPVMDG